MSEQREHLVNNSWRLGQERDEGVQHGTYGILISDLFNDVFLDIFIGCDCVLSVLVMSCTSPISSPHKKKHLADI